VFYFSFLSRQGAEPLGSTFTLRDKYEDSNTLADAVSPAFEPKEKGRKGRFCFGTLNAPKGALRNIYPFPMCTAFKFLPKKEYTLDGMYDKARGELVLFVNGKQESIEPRHLIYDDGPVTINSACHDRGNHEFSGRVWDAKIFKRAAPDFKIKQLPSGSNVLWAQKGSAVKGPKTEARQIGGSTIKFDRDSVWIHARVRPSAKDNNKQHVIFLAGGGQIGAGMAKKDCASSVLTFVWSRKRADLKTDAQVALEAAKDAAYYV
jgi:hypothetical protein